MPVTVKINYTTSTGEHSSIIQDATEFNDGVMTKEQVKKLNSLTPGGSGTGAIIYWTGQPWTDIYAIISALPAGQGAIVMVAEGNAQTLTAGDYNLDNVIFIGSGVNPGDSTLTAAAGFTLNASTTGMLAIRNLTFDSHGTILDTSVGGGGGFIFIAENCLVSLVANTYILDAGGEVSVTLIDSELTRNGFAGFPFVAGGGATYDLTVYDSIVGSNIFGGTGAGQLNINFDETAVLFEAYQTGFNVIVGAGPTQNEITVPTGDGAVVLQATLSDGSNGTPSFLFFQADGAPITTLTLSKTDAYVGQRLVLVLKQSDAEAGLSTWPSLITNAILAAGALNKTLTSDAIDVLEFIYSDVFGGAWVQVTPTTNLNSPNGNGTTVVQALSNDIPAPTNVQITRAGDSQFNLLVPAGITKFYIGAVSLRLIGVQAPDTAALTLGAVVLLDGVSELFPDANGIYTVVSGHTLTVFAAVVATYNGSVTAATKTAWGVEFNYMFL